MPNQTKIAGKVLDCGEASIYVLHCAGYRCNLRKRAVIVPKFEAA